MARIQLTSGAYTARSLIANAQRCVNLFPEVNPPDAPALATHYPTPGLTTLATATSSNCRAVYKASNGVLYVVEGGQVFVVDSAFTRTLLGTIPPGDDPVVMADNGLVVILVNGVANQGWVIRMSDHAFAQIVGDSFYGGTSVWYLDTYFLLNRPDVTAIITPDSAQWYISLPNVTFEDLTGGPVEDGVISGVGSGYADGTYVGVPLTGVPTETPMTATVTVTGGAVTQVDIDDGGGPYKVGDTLTANLNGQISTATLVGGAGYVNGSYENITLTGGSGAGFIANITVELGAITAVTPLSPGTGYAVGDVLTTDEIGLGTGFTYTVTAISGTGTGFTYVVSAVGLSGFDPLDFATKVDGADSIVNMIVSRGEVWLLGTQTSEVWSYNADPTFPFQRVDSVFVQYGCNAPYSVGSTDVQAVWLARNSQGHCLVLQAASYEVTRISTHAIEHAIAAYPNASILAASAFVYQQEGHTFYVLNFPVITDTFRGATWVYDFSTQLWHERTWTDGDGLEWRHRVSDAAFVYGKMVAGDWENGKLYDWSLNTYTDDGGPIVRRRGFPHMVADGRRLSYARFIADISVAQQAGLASDDAPLVSLRWSDTRGQTYGDPVRQSLGATGQYLTQPIWPRLGMARDRVFELFWDAPGNYALQGAFIEAMAART